jgi:UDP-N-acetylglucosamine 2-epimerase (non-hydrolysing)
VKLLVPVGTRPEIVKLAPVVRTLAARPDVEVRTIATGQHYDPALTDSFYARFKLQPDATWQLEGGEADRVATMMRLAWNELEASRPSAVLLLGDTYTVPVFSLAARRHGVPVVHLEAGLRSFNSLSMEEVNRKTAAALASLHFAPTPLAARFLADEGVGDERIKVVGNPVIDVLRQSGVQRRAPAARQGVVVTAHRRTNVDDPARLRRLEQLLRRLASELAPVTLPLHPRTRARLDEAGALEALGETPGLELCDPLPYGEMLELVARSRVVVTDSGGLQEEASWFRVPVVVLRHSTPRWEGVQAGTSVLTGLDVTRAVEAARRFASPAEQARSADAPCPYGDGHSARRIADALTDPATAPLLRLDEPDLRDERTPA